jgi:hypothetical protein
VCGFLAIGIRNSVFNRNLEIPIRGRGQLTALQSAVALPLPARGGYRFAPFTSLRRSLTAHHSSETPRFQRINTKNSSSLIITPITACTHVTDDAPHSHAGTRRPPPRRRNPRHTRKASVQLSLPLTKVQIAFRRHRENFHVRGQP